MKYLILLIIPLTLYASPFASISEVERCSIDSGADLFSDKINCERTKGSTCIEYPGGICHDLDVVDIMVPDRVKKEKAETCFDQIDCSAKEAALVCEQGRPIRTMFEVYCAVEIMKKEGKKLVHNEGKKQERERLLKIKETEEQAAKDKKKTDKDALRAQVKTAKTIKELAGILEKVLEE